MQQKLLCGLIESDWNLKPVTVETVAVRMPGINRIRLEFKVNEIIIADVKFATGLIESDWNLKYQCNYLMFQNTA